MVNIPVPEGYEIVTRSWVKKGYLTRYIWSETWESADRFRNKQTQNYPSWIFAKPILVVEKVRNSSNGPNKSQMTSEERRLRENERKRANYLYRKIRTQRKPGEKHLRPRPTFDFPLSLIQNESV